MAPCGGVRHCLASSTPEATVPALKNHKHELFAQLRAEGKSADEAYAEAGYKPDRGHASRLAANGNVQARVAQILETAAVKVDVSVQMVLQELARVGFSDIRNCMDADGNLLPMHQWSDAFAASVASIEVTTRTLPGEAEEQLDAQPQGGALRRRRNPQVEHTTKIRFWNKNEALEKIGRFLGMFEGTKGGNGTGETGEAPNIKAHDLSEASVQRVAKLLRLAA